MKITCIDKEVRQMFSGDYYEIPRFQRPYSWNRENVEEFWNDVIVESEEQHFIGSIVVYKNRAGKLGVVDGQQRLTTITMLLSAVRNAYSKNKFDNLANGVHQYIERRDIENQIQYVLQAESSYPYLQEYVQKFGIPDAKVTAGIEENLIEEAFDSLCEKVNSVVDSVNNNKSLGETKKKERIEKGLSKIRDRLLSVKLIFIELDDENDAYFVFETLNTRGKDLGVADLAKNHFVRLLRPGNIGVDLAKDQWEKIVETLEKSSAELTTDSFLYHWWLSRYEYTSSKKLFKMLRTKVTKANARHMLNELESDATIYRWKHEVAYRAWNQQELPIRESLEALNLFAVKQDLPMVISVLRAWKNGSLKIGSVRRILRAIECFHFMFTAVASQRSSGGISGMYALHARQLFDARSEDSRHKVIDDVVKKLKDRLPSKAEFLASFEQIQYSKRNSRRKHLVKYILSSLDSHNAKSGIAVDYSRMTIEHLAAESSKVHSDDAIGSIGNLLLLSADANTKLANQGFVQKKAALSGLGVWIDPTLKEATAWSTEEISKRARELGVLAFEKVWRI